MTRLTITLLLIVSNAFANNNRVSLESSNLIQKLEGYSPNPYTLHGVIHIGYGTVTEDNIKYITKQQAYKLMIQDIHIILFNLEKKLPNLNDNQYIALCSLIYNIGHGNFYYNHPELYSAIKKNPNNHIKIKKLFMGFIYANGRKMKGLIKRRQKEWRIYSTTKEST